MAPTATADDNYAVLHVRIPRPMKAELAGHVGEFDSFASLVRHILRGWLKEHRD